jgi:hypothetical protein
MAKQTLQREYVYLPIYTQIITCIQKLLFASTQPQSHIHPIHNLSQRRCQARWRPVTVTVTITITITVTGMDFKSDGTTGVGAGVGKGVVGDGVGLCIIMCQCLPLVGWLVTLVIYLKATLTNVAQALTTT